MNDLITEGCGRASLETSHLHLITANSSEVLEKLLCFYLMDLTNCRAQGDGIRAQVQG